jgi:hypothetical protein
MKLYVIIGGDGFVFDITTNMADTKRRVRSAVGAMEGCTVALFRVPQDLENVRALFFHTFGKRVPISATVLGAWYVTKRGALRPMPISDYEGLHDRLQRRVLGAQKAPRRLVERYFDPRLADGDDVLPIDSIFSGIDLDGAVSGDAEGAREAKEVNDSNRSEDPQVLAGEETPCGSSPVVESLPSAPQHHPERVA